MSKNFKLDTDIYSCELYITYTTSSPLYVDEGEHKSNVASVEAFSKEIASTSVLNNSGKEEYFYRTLHIFF